MYWPCSFLCRWSRSSFSSFPCPSLPPPMVPADTHSAHTCPGGIRESCRDALEPHPSRMKREMWIFFPGQLHFVLSQSWGRGRSWGKHSAADASICRLPHFLKGSLWEKAISSESPRVEGWGNFLPEWLEVFTFVINRSMLTENTKPNADIWSFWKFPVKHGWIYKIFPTNSTHTEGKWLQISGNGLCLIISCRFLLHYPCEELGSVRWRIVLHIPCIILTDFCKSFHRIWDYVDL